MNNGELQGISPFDDAAAARLRRMGLLEADGKGNRDAVSALARLSAGLFFDALCDTYAETATVLRIGRELTSTGTAAEPRRAFLRLCAEYDAMRRPIPEPLWWISGSEILVPPFMEGFLRNLADDLTGWEVMEKHENG